MEAEIGPTHQSIQMAKKKLSFKQHPQFRELRLLASFLDLIWEMPWSSPLLS
jgi:hypothetical protein